MDRFMKSIDVTSFVLLLIGALNWGLIGFWDFNLIGAILGHLSIASRILYAAIGLAGLYEIFTLKMIKERWTPICRPEGGLNVHTT